MKKTIIILLYIFITSCSSDNSNEAIIENKTPLIGVTLMPQNNNLVGYGQNISFILKKGNIFLKNTDYNWSLSDTLRGSVNVAGQFSSKIIGQTEVIVSDNLGNVLTSTITISPKVTDIPNIPFIEWGATKEDVLENVSLNVIKEDDFEIAFRVNNEQAFRYLFSSGKLFKVYFLYKYYPLTYHPGGADNPYILADFNNERFSKLNNSSPHYYGYQRWWFENQINQKIYVDIEDYNGLYMLRYNEN